MHFIDNNNEEAYYPLKVLGFVDTADGVEAVIQCAMKPLKWLMVENKILVAFDLGIIKASFVSVPLQSFVYLLCVFKDNGGPRNKYIVVLPRRRWVQYFGSDIK